MSAFGSKERVHHHLILKVALGEVGGNFVHTTIWLLKSYFCASFLWQLYVKRLSGGHDEAYGDGVSAR